MKKNIDIIEIESEQFPCFPFIELDIFNDGPGFIPLSCDVPISGVSMINCKCEVHQQDFAAPSMIILLWYTYYSNFKVLFILLVILNSKGAHIMKKFGMNMVLN